MAGAQIGALRVTLGLDAGAFESGSRKAANQMDWLQKRIGASGAAITRTLGVAASAFATAFSAQALRGTLLYADAMGKAAEAANMTVNDFSALAHAAELSGVSTEALSAALNKFNEVIAKSAKGGSDAAIAFSAMGISVRESTGQARDMMSLLGDVADRFSLYKQSADKSALAQQLFGQAGANLIPLLNRGRVGLKELADEARRLGIVLDDEAVRNAGEFNEAITRLSNAARAAGMNIAGAFAPALASLFEGMTALIERNRRLREEMDADIRSDKINRLTRDHREASVEVGRLEEQFRLLNEQGRNFTPGSQSVLAREWAAQLASVSLQLEQARTKAADLWKQLGDVRTQPIGDWRTSTTTGDAPGMEAERIRQMNELSDAQRRAAESMQLFEYRSAAANQVIRDTASPLDEYKAKLLELAQAQRDSGVSAQQMAHAHAQASNRMIQAYGGVVSNVTGALKQLFEKNKAFAYADALVKTYLAFNQALVAPPGPPWSYANAAAALASGMAQVRGIQGTQFGSVGGASGGGASGGASSSASEAAPQAVPSSNLYVTGVDSSHFYSGNQMRELFRAINDHIRNGGRIEFG